MAVEPDRTQLRLPAPEEQRASHQQNRRGGALAHADGQRKLRRAEAGAPRRARSRAGAGADIARARGLVRVRVQHAHRPRASSGRADRSWAVCVAAVRAVGGTPVDGGLVSLGSEEVGDEVDHGVDRHARILVPRRVHCDVCAWGVVRAERSVLWRDYRVDLVWRLVKRGEDAGLRRRSHLKLKRRLRLELKDVDLLFVERRWQCDDEW